MAAQNPKAIADRERQRHALELRRKGLTWERVAEEAGYHDASTAFRAVSRILDRVETEQVEGYRAEELHRLNETHGDAVRHVERLIEAGELGPVAGALGVIVRISERRSKLLGLDAPTRVDVGAADADLEAVLARVTALMDAQTAGAEGTE